MWNKILLKTTNTLNNICLDYQWRIRSRLLFSYEPHRRNGNTFRTMYKKILSRLTDKSFQKRCKQIAFDLEVGLKTLRTNLINYVFAALILGLTCSRKTSQHSGWRGKSRSLCDATPLIFEVTLLYTIFPLLYDTKECWLPYFTRASPWLSTVRFSHGARAAVACSATACLNLLASVFPRNSSL